MVRLLFVWCFWAGSQEECSAHAVLSKCYHSCFCIRSHLFFASLHGVEALNVGKHEQSMNKLSHIIQLWPFPVVLIQQLLQLSTIIVRKCKSLWISFVLWRLECNILAQRTVSHSSSNPSCAICVSCEVCEVNNREMGSLCESNGGLASYFGHSCVLSFYN